MSGAHRGDRRTTDNSNFYSHSLSASLGRASHTAKRPPEGTAREVSGAHRGDRRTTDNGQPTTEFSPVIIKRFEDLDVYQLAMRLQREIFVLSKDFPKEERYSLTDQIRRSSRSVGANLAEAWHKRRYPAHFASKLTDADAECAETRHWLQTACDSGYLGEDPVREFIDRYLAVGAKLGHMIQSADQWVPR